MSIYNTPPLNASDTSVHIPSPITLTSTSVYPVHSLETKITVKVKLMGDRLVSIKGTGQVQPSQRNAIINEADEVVEPLMELLGDSLSMYDHSCEKTIFKRVLKELWKIVITTMEKAVVLPPMTDKAVSLPYVRTIKGKSFNTSSEL